ncbi:MAG: universal stress protein [Rhizobiales bacterium]|nr:universal stress protein [Hyphomicrobiales bacterium]
MYSEILAPVDLAHPETAKRMVTEAKALADKTGSKLTLLNVVPAIPGFAAAELPAGTIKKMVSDAERELRKLASDLGLDKSARTMLRSGKPHSQILQVADEISADLIVIASHQPGIEDYLLGSVASRVVRHAKCSVLVERQLD